MDNDRLTKGIHIWSKYCGRSLDKRVSAVLTNCELMNPMLTLSKHDFMRLAKNRLVNTDGQKWYNEMWNDNGHLNGNKLRTYREYKRDLAAEHYVKNVEDTPSCFIPF